jgi:hypothetical protein
MKYVVVTQYMENYGFDDERGTADKPYQSWKMKFGGEYCVHDMETPQNAMAFVAENVCLNQPGYTIEWPADVSTYEDYQDARKPGSYSRLEHISPSTIKAFK